MRHTVVAAVSLLAFGLAAPAVPDQVPLNSGNALLDGQTTASKPRKLTGQFLHITDLHPDPFFEYHSSTQHDDACHRGHGAAGYYGAETSACDSPLSLINATFDWIAANLADEVDFVVWTGDSARHDNDEDHPRTAKQVTSLNQYVASKFSEVFGGKRSVPVIPTLGNNDVLPHNVFFPGPNRWTRTYLDVWRDFIPEEQRHGFSSGGWFYVEAIPNHLAIFSLNSLYFFDSNSAVTGCAARSEPGYEQFDWLRVQLQFMRQRGMRAILTGHVPPARTDSKQSWDESCWQKYTLWMHQFRDVVVASLWGHMNTDHFLIHDSTEVDFSALLADNVTSMRAEFVGEGMSIQSSTEYLTDLREQWSDLPHILDSTSDFHKHEDIWSSVGGKLGERYSLSLVAPSVVPNYFPSLRIISYEISDIDAISTIPDHNTNRPALDGADVDDSVFEVVEVETHDIEDSFASDDEPSASWLEWLSTTKKHKHKKNKKKYKFKTPKGPSKSAPPGPAYSAQSLSLLGYKQLFANLTHINNDFVTGSSRWNPGKHADKDVPQTKPAPRDFAFELEYDTRAEADAYGLPDMTVRSYLELAKRIGRYKVPKGSEALEGAVSEDDGDEDEDEDESVGQAHAERKDKNKKKKGKKGKKEKKRAKRNTPWLTFVRRAFVSARDDKDLHDDFGREFVPLACVDSAYNDMDKVDEAEEVEENLQAQTTVLEL